MRKSVLLVVSWLGLACANTSTRGGRDGLAPPLWQALATPTQASLRAIAVVDRDTLWIGGTNGTLLRTVDGGGTWLDVAPPDSARCDFRDLAVFAPDTALAMVAGQPARLYRTEDGGKSWQVVHADVRPTAFFDGIAFDGTHGILFGDPIDGAFCVWTSADEGRTWNPVPAAALPVPLPGEAAFAASGTCVAVTGSASAPTYWVATGGGPRARLLRGHRGEWRALDVPLRASGTSRGGFGLAVGADGAVLVGGDYGDPRRSDGTAAFAAGDGMVWHSAAGGAGGYRSGAVWLDADTVLAVGSHGTSVSADRGQSWSCVASDGFHSLGIGRDGAVFACGSQGRVARCIWPGH